MAEATGSRKLRRNLPTHRNQAGNLIDPARHVEEFDLATTGGV